MSFQPSGRFAPRRYSWGSAATGEPTIGLGSLAPLLLALPAAGLLGTVAGTAAAWAEDGTSLGDSVAETPSVQERDHLQAGSSILRQAEGATATMAVPWPAPPEVWVAIEAPPLPLTAPPEMAGNSRSPESPEQNQGVIAPGQDGPSDERVPVISDIAESPLSAAVETPPVLLASAVTPAADGVGTVVNPQGNQLDITGGQRSRDGANLFHSFSQFGLSQGQIANFLSTPATRNILTRITGGNASVIDGILRITGGNSNLYLMNPAGIVFGPNASLNVSGSFTATTASGIGFSQGWFNATGLNDYGSLTGEPTGLGFAMSQPGAIVNRGNLAAGTGQSLNLVGGTVVSTGSLQAPEGQITVAAVPGTSFVRLSQAGQVLSLEVQQPGLTQALPASQIDPLPLPQLLTGGAIDHASNLTVNPDGTVQLTGSNLVVQPGDGVVTQATAQTMTLASQNNLTVLPAEGRSASLQTTGDLTLLAGNQVLVRDMVTDPVRVEAGGNLRIQGNQGIDLLALNHLTPAPFQSGGDTTLVSDGVISTDSHFSAGGNFAIQNRSGDRANFLSLYDPIINVGGNYSVGDYTGASLVVNAGGSITYGSVVINAIDPFINPIFPVFSLQAGGGITGTGNVSTTLTGGGLITTFQAGSGIAVQGITTGGGNVSLTTSGGNISTGTISTTPVGVTTGNISLTAPNGSVSTGDLNTSDSLGLTEVGGTVSVTAGGTIGTGAINTFSNGDGQPTGGAVSLSAPLDITFSSIDSRGINSTGPAVGGNVTIATTQGRVQGSSSVAGTTISSAGNPFRGQGGNGTIFIQHAGGVDNFPFVVGATSPNGTAGIISSGAGAITTATYPVLPNGGDVTPSPGITIRSINTPPSLEIANSTVVAIPTTAGVAITYADLAPTVTDINQDNTLLLIDSVLLGSLTKNGVPVVPGVTTLAPGETLVFTPPAGFFGVLTDVFRLRATDQVSQSNLVSVNVANQFSSQLVNQLLPPIPEPAIAISGEPECSSTDIGVYSREDRFTQEFEDYLGRRAGDRKSLIQTCKELSVITAATGVKPAIVYASFVPGALPDWNQGISSESPTAGAGEARDSDQLELVVVSEKGPAIYRRLSVTRGELLKTAREFRRTVSDPLRRNSQAYLSTAQKLYSWLVAPYETALVDRQIQNLVFIMDAGLRTLPIGALHDGNQFLVEKYSLGLMPSLSLTDTRPTDLKQAEILAMGASEFADQQPLPAVPVELESIRQQQWRGKFLLNRDFTLNNLINERKAKPYGIVHLATHTEFAAGQPENSYIQLGDTRLRLDQIRQLGWDDPPVKLLVLSSCQTALGDLQAELGFAGLAYQTGVKSALATLWSVDDAGTLALMAKFYQQLRQAPIRSEALRQAQIAMLRKQVSLQDQQLSLPGLTLPLPPEFQGLPSLNLSHPYYWAGFTMVGNPW